MEKLVIALACKIKIKYVNRKAKQINLSNIFEITFGMSNF